MKLKLVELKGEIDNNIIYNYSWRVGHSSLGIDRKNRQKISEDIDDLNNHID